MRGDRAQLCRLWSSRLEPIEQTARPGGVEQLAPLRPRHRLQALGPGLQLAQLLWLVAVLHGLDQALDHLAVEQVQPQGLPQPAAQAARRIVGLHAHQLFLAQQYAFKFLELDPTGRHRVHEEFELGQQIEHRLVVERHLDKLLRTEGAYRLISHLDPGRTEDHRPLERTSAGQAFGHGREAVQGNLLDLLRVTAAETTGQRGQELRE